MSTVHTDHMQDLRAVRSGISSVLFLSYSVSSTNFWSPALLPMLPPDNSGSNK
jgi:hypothetical protein